MSRCEHNTTHRLWWWRNSWRRWADAVHDGLRWDDMAARRCNGCGAWLPLGHSDETPVAVEVRAAEIAADEDAKMSMCESFGWESWLAPKFSTDPVDKGYADKWHAGYLARCIVEHEEDSNAKP